MTETLRPGRQSLKRAALISFLSIAMALAGCSENDAETEGCETSEECPEGQICQDEICIEGEGDGDPDGDGEEIVIEEEDYLISFRARTASSFPNRTAAVRVLGSRDESDNDLLTEDIDCVEAHSCGVTKDFAHFIEIRETEPGEYDAYSAPIDAATMTISGSPERFLEGISNPRLRGNGVIYRRVEEGRYVGYYHGPGESAETMVAGLANVGASPGRGWDADPIADRARYRSWA